MRKSIIPLDDDKCYICKYLAKVSHPMLGTETHHMIYGTAKRRLADEDGLTVRLCNFHHMRLHQFGAYKEDLQQIAQRTWQDHYQKTTKDFIKRYGKSYL